MTDPVIDTGGTRRNARLAQILMDLDRCAHGRHAEDSCFDCPSGRSAGNPHLRPGTVIGYRYTGEPIRMPDRSRGESTSDIEAWLRLPG